MSLRLALAERFLPRPLRRLAVREVVKRTARAFDAPPPPLAGATLDEALGRLAAFTREEADRAQGRGSLEAARRRLGLEGREMGARARRLLGVRSRADAMRAARVLYGILDVDFEGTPEGAIEVRRCRFSRHYASATCELISALDEGLLAGLGGEGTLRFRERLTGGAGRCVAQFTFADGAP